MSSNQQVLAHRSLRLEIKNQKPKIICALYILLFILLYSEYAQGAFYIVRNNEPSCSIIISESPSIQEDFAADELNHFVENFTGKRLAVLPDSEPLPPGNVILIGTPDSNRYIGELADKGLVSLKKSMAQEEFFIKVVSDEGRDILMIAGGQSRGALYGVYALVEKMIESIMEISPVDLDFYVPPVSSLSVGMLNIRSSPFYPIRCALSVIDSRWMSRHRVNVSGAEGVWSGTGIDDGLGTAFKYVKDSKFNNMQDETVAKRSNRITELRGRLMELKRRGIDSYLFMYVMGEPTKAIMNNYPELLEDMVYYGASRNGIGYRPISWTNPEARELIKELVKSIVRTYSPWLTGFHLRSWGWETRAPGEKDAEHQKLLWEIHFDIIEAAREVDPDFKFLISGYDEFWLQDPDRIYAAQLPRGTIFMSKWGVDGEPTNDPDIDLEYINSLGRYGHYVLVFSHDTEEVMPLWMLETDMFVEGVRKYANDPSVNGLGGFTLQGENGLAHLDKIVSARIGWNPQEDYVALMHNYLTSYYGGMAAQHILAALRINSLAMADYFSDYAGSLSVTGRYGTGSRGYATRLWDIIGLKAVKDTLAIPDLETVEYAKERLASLLPRQQEAANEMVEAEGRIRFVNVSVNAKADQNYLDGMHLMKMWVRFFESRLRLVEAREAGIRGTSRERISQKLASAAEYSREMQVEIGEIKEFAQIFQYDNYSARRSLIDAIDEEIDFLKNLDPADILITRGRDSETGEPELRIKELMNHPNPMNDKADFCYTLTSRADKVIITVYTVRGRRVRTITREFVKAGYNEESWQGKDDNGRKLANGTYLYKMVAKRDGEMVQRIDKLSIAR